MNIKEIKESIGILHTNTSLTPMLVGHHGKGKSQVVRQITEEAGIGFVDLRLGTQESGDILGLCDFEKDEMGNTIATKFMRPSWFPTEGRGIIFLDEINRARKDVLQAVFQLVLDKQFHTHKLPEGWSIVAACNPDTDDYVVTDMQDKALIDRFCYLKFEPTVQEWIGFARDQGIHEHVLNFISKQPEMLEGKVTDFALDFIQPSRRSTLEMAKLYTRCGNSNLFKEIAFGIVGVPATAAFLKHVKEDEIVINGKELLHNYMEIKPTLLTLLEKNRYDVVNRALDDIISNVSWINENHQHLKPLIMDLPNELAIKLMNVIEQTDIVVIENYYNDDDLVNKFD